MDCQLSGHLANAVCSKLNSGKLNTAHFKHSMPVLGEGLFGFSQFVTRLSYPIIIMLVSFLSSILELLGPARDFPFWAADSKDAPAATAEPFSATLKMKAKPLEATLLPLALDPVCSDHDSPADDREAQAHEEVRMPVGSLRRVDSPTK